MWIVGGGGGFLKDQHKGQTGGTKYHWQSRLKKILRNINDKKVTKEN